MLVGNQDHVLLLSKASTGLLICQISQNSINAEGPSLYLELH